MGILFYWKELPELHCSGEYFDISICLYEQNKLLISLCVLLSQAYIYSPNPCQNGIPLRNKVLWPTLVKSKVPLIERLCEYDTDPEKKDLVDSSSLDR